MKTKILFLFSFFTLLSFSQNDTLDQHDEKKRKNGWWMVYLNKNWKHVKDTSQAFYYRFNYFDHGTNIYPMGTAGKNNWKLETEGEPLTETKFKMLDGVYKWYDNKGHLFSEHVFKEGQYISCKEYYMTGLLHQHFDYTKKCKRQIHGWCVSVYDQKGKLSMEGCMCKGRDGVWALTH